MESLYIPFVDGANGGGKRSKYKYREFTGGKPGQIKFLWYGEDVDYPDEAFVPLKYNLRKRFWAKVTGNVLPDKELVFNYPQVEMWMIVKPDTDEHYKKLLAMDGVVVKDGLGLKND